MMSLSPFRVTPLRVSVVVAALLCAAPFLAPANVHAACAGAPGYPKVPFIDANCDACFDVADGDDADISQAELEQQPFNIDGCFVVPEGAHVVGKKFTWRTYDPTGDMTILGDVGIVSSTDGDGVFLSAGGKLTVGGPVRASLVKVRTEETPNVRVLLEGARGVEILPRTKISARGAVALSVTEGGEIVVGARSKLHAVKGGLVMNAQARDVFGPWMSPAGDITVGDRVQLKARYGIEIRGAGAVALGAGVSLHCENADAPSVLVRAGYAVSQFDSDLGGDLTIGPKLAIQAPDSIAMTANGAIHVGSAAKLMARRDDITFTGQSDVVVTEAKMVAFWLTATSAGGDVTISGRLKANPNGIATFEAPAGTCDTVGLAGLDLTTQHYDCAATVP